MSKKISVSVAIAITLIAMTVTFSITMIVSMNIFDNAVNDVIQKQALYNKITELDTYIRNNYYGDIDDQNMSDQVSRGFINGLDDAYSTYYTAEEYTLLQDIEAGRVVGVGLVGTKDVSTGYFRVIKVYSDSPAAAAGLQAGMYITEVDGTSARQINTANGLNTLLRGEQGTTVTIRAEQGREEQVFEIQRINYSTPTVESQIVNGISYIRIYAFSGDTASDFDYAVREAERLGVAGFVFDLRGTYSGTVDNAYDMIDMLCPLGTIARAELKGGLMRALRSSDAENYVDLPMVCLVNENTAGAAELFAACVRDLAGGELVGARTAGRGTLQRAPQQLLDGSAVVVTYALLYAGEAAESFNGVGLLPDHEVNQDLDDPSILYIPQFNGDSVLTRALELAATLARAQGLEIPNISTGGAGNANTPAPSASEAGNPEEQSVSSGEEDEGGEEPDGQAGADDDSGSDAGA